MKASLIYGVAKLKKKKIPNLFLGICIAIMAALLVYAIVFIKELNAVFDRSYKSMEGAHLCCLWSNEMFSPDYIRNYLEQSQEKFEYQITEHTKTIDYIEKNGMKLSNGILLELPESIGKDMLSPKLQDSLKPVMPKTGEIWVTSKLANILKLKEGDKISLQLADQAVQVTAAKIVTDPVFGSSGTNIYRMWCGYGGLSYFPRSDNNAVSYLEIKFEDYSYLTEQKFIHDTEEFFKMPLGNALYTYDKIKSGYTSIYQMVGAAFCFVSMVLALTVVALTLFLLKSDMDEDARNIGILKSLGMKGIEIINSYLFCYGLVGFAGAVFGCVIGGWLCKKAITGILSDLGIKTVSFAGITLYQLFVCFIVLSAMLLVCWLSVLKIWKLHASYAIRKGVWQTSKFRRKEGRNYYSGRLSFTFFYALRGIKNRKLRYGYIAAVSLIFSSLTVLCVGCLNAVSAIDQEPEVWGFIKSDIYVTSVEDIPVSGVIHDLEREPEVDYTYGVNKVYVTYKPSGQDAYKSIMTELYEIPWNEKIKDRSLYGTRPVQNNEIGAGLGLATEYGFKVGDTIELFVNGKKGNYEITEIFQTLSNYGNVFRMVTDDLDRFVEPNDSFGDYMLVLRKGIDKWEYAEELTERYDGKFAFIASKTNGENFTGVLTPAAGMIFTVLMAVIILITMNLTYLLVKREQSQIGLLKAIGLTSWQTLKIYLYRNCLASAMGCIIGTLTGTFFLPYILSPYAKLAGLTKFPFSFSPTGAALSLLLAPACMILGTDAIMKTIRVASVKELVNE